MSKPNIYDQEFSKRMQWIAETKFENNYSKFARAIGVVQPSLTRWVRGEADTTRANLIKIAEVADVSIEWLTTGKSHGEEYRFERPKPEPSVKEALETLQQAIARLPAIEPQQKSDGLSAAERRIVGYYRVSDEIGKMKIETTAEVVASMTSADEINNGQIEDRVA